MKPPTGRIQSRPMRALTVAALCLLGCLAMLSLTGCAGHRPASPPPAADPEALVREGRLEQAVTVLRARCASPEHADSRRDLLLLGQAELELGLDADAARDFAAAVKAGTTPAEQAEALCGEARALLRQDKKTEAAKRVDQGLALLEPTGQPGIQAELLLVQGEWALRDAQPAKAAASFAQANKLAQNAGTRLIAATALIGQSRALAAEHAPAATVTTALQAARDALVGLPDSHQAAYASLALGRAWIDDVPAPSGQTATTMDQARTAFQTAVRMGEALGDRRVLTYGYGYLGEVAEKEGNTTEAQAATRQAMFAAQEIGAREALFLWQWRQARLLAAAGQSEGALDSYARAVATYQALRQEVCDLPASAQGTVMSLDLSRRLFRGFADLLLRQATSGSPEAVKKVLLRTRDVIEIHKTVEIQNYFHDPCVTQRATKKNRLDELSPKAAVLYPIVLPDRLELILSCGREMTRKTVPMDAATLSRKAKALRHALEERYTFAYKDLSREFYDLLVKPFEPALQAAHANILVVVPDGPLRLVPMAALHDGKGFLIERLAVVTTPGLDLTDPHPLSLQDQPVLLAGLSDAVQGFRALPKVKEELEGLHHDFTGEVLANDAFRRDRLENILSRKNYAVIHIATHGEFLADAAKSYLLTWDDRITMNQLDMLLRLTRYRQRPVELLTLSACRTAAGDEQAALGLAGVAVKAGARSALATLWNVSDNAASNLVLDFYTQLKTPGMTKAMALRQAQLDLLRDSRFHHPYYWSAFMLIGNWL